MQTLYLGQSTESEFLIMCKLTKALLAGRGASDHLLGGKTDWRRKTQQLTTDEFY